ncbi:MAG: hypothetical protein HPY71_15045 [Firmicutes bacterium]|nr:hypothetical protein [Bacillota bacterium]
MPATMRPGELRRVAIKATLFFYITALIFSPLQAQAATDMGVSPSKLELLLDPGESTTEIIRVTNSAPDRIHFKAYVMDWLLSQEGEFTPIPPGTGERSASSWAKVVPIEFDLGPEQTQDVRVSISVPRGVSGEYRTVVFFESAPSQVSGMFGVSVVGRIGVVVYVNIRGTIKREGGVADLTVDYDRSKEMLTGRIGFENTGNTHLVLNATVELKDAGGRRVALIEETRGVCLPESYVQLPFRWQGTLSPGEYIVLAVIDYGGATRIAGQTVLEVPE